MVKRLLVVVGFVAAASFLLWVTFMLALIPEPYWYVGWPA